MGAIMFVLCGGILVLVWLLTIGLFEPAYYKRIERELDEIVNTVQETMNDPTVPDTLNTDTLEELERSGVCVEIAFSGNEVKIYYEGIGDGCVLHYDGPTNFFDQATVDKNSALAISLRERAEREGSFSTIVANNVQGRQFIVGTYLPDRQATIIASTNLERVTQALAVFRQQLITISYLVMLVALIVAILLARWISRPITTLTEATRRMAHGEYSVSVPVESDDELGVLAQDFNRMAREVNRSDQLQKELVANFSHDLRTPLTLIKGYAETIRDLTGENAEKRDQQLEVIIDEADRLSQLVSDALEFSRYNAGMIQMKPVVFDLNEMLQEMAVRYRMLEEKEGCQIVTQLGEQGLTKADPVLIERVIHNLMSNAWAHVGTDKTILLRSQVTDEGIKVTVEDHGEGIREEDLPHLFDRYYRARSSEGRTGTGLGLSIVKAILESHGFPYGVESRPEEGSRFWFVAKRAER